jgi:hypothetical protein
LNHAFHGLLNIQRLGHLLFFPDLYVRHLGHHLSRFSVRLVVTVVVFGSDVDEADREGLVDSFDWGGFARRFGSGRSRLLLAAVREREQRCGLAEQKSSTTGETTE